MQSVDKQRVDVVPTTQKKSKCKAGMSMLMQATPVNLPFTDASPCSGMHHVCLSYFTESAVIQQYFSLQ
jgi:hypothetical protein